MKHHDPNSLTPKQAARYLGALPGARRPDKVQRLLPHLVAAGLLTSHKRGRGWTRYAAADLDAARAGIVDHLRQGIRLNKRRKSSGVKP